MARTRTLILVAAALLLGVTAPVAAAAADEGETDTFKIEDPRITESSGLAASALHPGVFWTHNDSDDGAKLYAVDSADGETKAVVTLDGVKARDWEALALGKDDNGRPALFVGDIGDNLKGEWPEVYVYRFAEPVELKDQTVDPVKYRVKYEDGARDAEAMLIDPKDNRIYIASKQEPAKAGLYVQPEVLDPKKVNTFKRVSEAPGTVTDGAFSPDGSRFVLRGYFSATMFSRDSDAKNASSATDKETGPVNVPLQRQGESVTFSADGRNLMFGSEGKGSQVRKVGLSGDLRPDSVRTAGKNAPAAVPGEKSEVKKDGESTAKKSGPWLLAVLAVVLVYFGYKKLGRKA